jgi:sugar/nucleoside kinase (ribokinase family)
LGVETNFVGGVDDALFGETLAGELQRADVTPHLTRDPSLSTGKVFVLVNGAGERTMITDRGAGEALSPEDLPEPLFCEGHLAARVVEQVGGRPRT